MYPVRSTKAPTLLGGTLAATGLDLAAPLLLALVLLVGGALLLRWSVLNARRDGTAG